MNDLRTAAQQALEQAEPVQEPAFHGFMSADGTQVDLCFTPSAPRSDGAYATAYYTSPPKAEPVQEPVAWYFEARHIDSAWAAAVTLKHPGPEGKYLRKVTPLYTAPPHLARAVERAHGIV